MKNQYQQKRREWDALTTIAGVLAAFTLTAAVPASAQNDRGNGRQGSGGGGGFGGQQRQGRPALTLSTVPVAAMTPYFGLSEDQAKKIEEIQKSARSGMQEMATRFQSMRGQFGDNPSPQDQEKMRAEMLKMRTEAQTKMAQMQQNQTKADREIRQVMTEEQRPGTPLFLREAEFFQNAGLPLELIKALNLESMQKVKINVILDKTNAERQQKMQAMFANARSQNGGRGNNGGGAAAQAEGANANGGRANWQAFGETMRTDAEATRKLILEVLTAEQRTLVEKFEKENPQSRQRGFGGFGRGGN